MNAPLQPTRFAAVLDVTAKRHVTPNMIRVTLTGPDLASMPEAIAGGHCKLMLPGVDQDRDAFFDQFSNGPRPTTRTYTIRYARPDKQEIDIDFVDHGDEGPASGWACRARPGDFIGFAGPGLPKLVEFDADFYIIAADMSALPVAGAACEGLPDDAQGIAVFEITSEADKQDFKIPPGIAQHWILHSDPHHASRAQIDALKGMPWPEGKVRTMIAGETDVVRELRLWLRGDKEVDRKAVYASGYWRIGLAEDEHQKVKNELAKADEAELAKKGA